jgi:hypothetical protein
MSKTLLAESFGQHLLDIFTALSPFYVEQPHDKGSALYKYPTISCKNNLERSTDPSGIDKLILKIKIKKTARLSTVFNKLIFTKFRSRN